MRKSFIKIISILVIIALNWSGLSAVIQTISYYLDNEGDGGNTFTAATLDFSLRDTSDVTLTSPLFNISGMQKNESQQKIVRVYNDGTLDFQYKVNLENVSGDLCSYLTLQAQLDGDPLEYNGTVQNTTFPTSDITYSSPNDDWTFTLTLSGSAPENETCNFDLAFDGVQIGGAGFSDTEFLSNNVTSGTWQTCWVQTTKADFDAGTKSNIDTSTSPGDAKLTTTGGGSVTLRPNANGDTTQLNRDGGSSNWSRVDETSSDGDSSYVYSTGSGEAHDLYNLGDTSQTGTINSVIVHSRMRQVAGSSTSAGPNNAGTGTDVSGVGTLTWSDPGNISIVGSPYATSTGGASAITHYLEGTDYSFNIPSGATINGIQVTINRASTRAGNCTDPTNLIACAGFVDNIVSLIKSGSVTGTNKAVTTTIWPTSLTTITYGSASELWGTTWTPADINNTNFGVAFSAKVTASALSNKTATVDYMYITVYYTYTSSTNGRTYIKTNGTEYSGDWNSLTTTYTDYSQTYTTNPQTLSGWTWDEINNLQAGVSFQNATGGARATQVWVEVNYSGNYYSSGTLTSQIFDSGKMTDWQTLSWDENIPTGTDIKLEARVSNNGTNWSSWYLLSSVTPIDLSSLPDSRYIQWRSTLSTSVTTNTPVLQEVRTCYSAGETFSLSDIKLNEFLPNPEGVEYGWDFGDDGDSKPKGEWVEIYNNGNSSVDLADWDIQDAGADHTITISNSNTNTGSTIIGPKGSGNEWLVIYMNHAVFSGSSNSSGDTVYLYDSFGAQVDYHSYDTSNKCDLEPTPGDPNGGTATGNCYTYIPGNKSYARIPDGTGSWVDPIPTPGKQNKLEEVALEEEIIEENEEEEIIPEEEEEGLIDEIVDEIVEEILPETEPIDEETIIEETPIPSIEDGATGQVIETTTDENPVIEPSENAPATETETISAPENNSIDNSASDSSSVSENSGGESSNSDTGAAGADAGSTSADSGASADSGSAAAGGDSVSQ